MNKKAIGLDWVIFIIILILIVLYMILNNVYLTHTTFETEFWECENGEPIAKEMFYIESCDATCGASSSSWVSKTKNVLSCEDDKAVCECKTTVWITYISPLF